MIKKVYELEQQSILIHFQANCEGNGTNVCLRASEVKPKFDRFLVKKLGGREKVIQYHQNWIRALHTNGIDISFNYRMTIRCNNQNITLFESRNKNYDPKYRLPNIYYGNMSSEENSDKKTGVFFNDGLQLSILCFDDDLCQVIDQYIAEFFAVTNFGTMQDKGFGSFIVKDRKVIISEALKNNYSSSSCYVVDVSKKGSSSDAQNELFETIKQIYSIMKSGQNIIDRNGRTLPDKYIRSYLTQYMHQKHNIGNEKACMKVSGAAPIRQTSDNLPDHNSQSELQEYRYIRALLGIGGHAEWYEPDDEQLRANRSRPLKEKITVTDVTKGKEKIERCASPIFFKIVGSRIFITADCVDERVFDRIFCFKNSGYTRRTRDRSPRNGKFVEIHTLSGNEGKNFDIANFLKCFMTYYNNNIRKMRKKHRIEVAK